MAQPSAAAMALSHRYRFAAPLCAGRIVLDVAGAASHKGAFAAARKTVGPAAKTAQVVVSLVPLPEPEILAMLPGLLARLPAEGTVAVAVEGVDGQAVQGLLAARFKTVAAFVQRPILGSLVAAAPFAASRMTALADAAPAGNSRPGPLCWTILIAGDALPTLLTGLLETPMAAPDRLPSIDPPDASHRPDDDGGPAWAPDVERARAVSLVERLMDLDEALFALTAENRDLRRGSGAVPVPDRAPEFGAVGAIVALDRPQPTYPWPLAEHPDTKPDTLEPYDRRPEDDLIQAARAGAAFLATHRLLDKAPDFAAAVAALNRIRPTLHLVPLRGADQDEPPTPDVSIVIPVYGQLAYTLNCLDGLLRHASRHSVEIIVIDDVSVDETAAFLPFVSGVRSHRRASNGGFIAACNAGAALARGRFIVLLNNDTRPLPGWLDELIASFTRFPRAGLVGSKLLYADGTLQEAGGIVWRDGSAWNYGRGDDPNRPRYCHAREVDYASGAAIALPMSLWRELEGLDAHFAPAYYEDTDLAFRVRAKGRQVWLQPTSRVIHYEGRTSGTDPNAGVKAYQAINRGKFFYRWRETLLRHGIERGTVSLERERQVARRAVLLDDTTPTPRQDAGSNYTLLTMRLFIALGYKLSFVPQDNFLYQPGHTTDLHRMGIECAYAPYELGTDVYLRRYGMLFDIAMVSRMQVLEAVIGELDAYAPQAPVLFNTHDLAFLRMRRAAELAGNPGMLAMAEEMRERELALMRKVDCIITPSAFEAEILRRELPDIPTRVLPIMTDLEGTEVGFAARRDVCFLGGYSHPPNIDAVRFFVDEIFPLLKAKEPRLRFIVAGANPTPELLALARDDIEVTGMIDDLRDVFDRARVFVCPLRIGAGAKGKVASAMSYGLPVVSTSIGAEGMGLVDGQTVLVADTPAAFAASCLRLYRDRALWERMSAASLDLVREVASPQARERIFADAIDAALRHKLGLPA
jgi:GT2 family glycosyltransferase/glycosyltransferase involved in cell wall biosynthesis